MSEPAPESEVIPRKKAKVTAKTAHAIREVIEAARFTKRPGIKAIAAKHRIAHSYLKTWYNNWTRGLVDLSRGDKQLAEPIQRAVDNKVEMGRDLSLIAQLGQVISDQIEGSIVELNEVPFSKRMQKFSELRVERLMAAKQSLARWRFITEKGYLVVEEETQRLAQKAEKEEAGRFDAAKEIQVEVVATTMSETERFRSVFKDLGLKQPDAVNGTSE